MKYLLLAGALAFGIAGPCLAQESGKTATTRNANPGGPKIGNSDRTGGHSELSGQAGITGPTATSAGNIRPCGMQTSRTSDHEGGHGKASTSSLNSAGGSVSGCQEASDPTE